MKTNYGPKIHKIRDYRGIKMEFSRYENAPATEGEMDEVFDDYRVALRTATMMNISASPAAQRIQSELGDDAKMMIAEIHQMAKQEIELCYFLANGDYTDEDRVEFESHIPRRIEKLRQLIADKKQFGY